MTLRVLRPVYERTGGPSGRTEELERTAECIVIDVTLEYCTVMARDILKVHFFVDCSSLEDNNNLHIHSK